jgi:hypothetical protein
MLKCQLEIVDDDISTLSKLCNIITNMRSIEVKSGAFKEEEI